MSKRLAAVAATSILALTAACGGADRPTADELSAAFTAEDAVVPVPEDYADCVAEQLVDSEVSDDTLNAIVEQDEDYEGSEEEADVVLEEFGAAQEECITAE